MAKKIQLQDANGNVLHPLTLGECVTMDNGENLDTLMSKSQMFTPTITQDKSMFKVGTGIDVDYSANVKDGAYESLMFKGKSLVNLWKKHDTHNQRNFTLYEDGFMETVPNVLYFDHIQKANTEMIKPNTKYLLIVEVTKNTLPVPISLQSDNRTYFYGNSGTMFGAGETGVVKKIITSISDLSTTRDDLRWGTYIQFVQANVSESERGIVKIRQMLIEYVEGMENWDIPYFTGLCDSKMPILRNIGKNLFDKTKTTPNKYIASTGAELDEIGTNRNSTDYIRVSPNSEIVLSGIKNSGTTNSSTQFYIAQYGEDKQLIKCQAFTVTSDSTKLTTDSATRYIRTTVKDDDLNRCQIEQSSTLTTYENYKTNILRTSEEVVLRSVGNVKDTYNALTGEYMKRIGEVVIDGSSDEVWGMNEVWSAGDVCSFFNTALVQPKGVGITSDRLPSKTRNELVQGEIAISEGIRSDVGNIQVFIDKSKLTTTNVDGFKLWLSQNPITIQYPLTTPVTTIIKPPTIPFAYANGHVVLESGYSGQSLLPTLKYSAVTGRTGQVTQNAKILHQQEKQIASLEDLLLTQIVQMDYERTLLQFDFELSAYGLDQLV